MVKNHLMNRLYFSLVHKNEDNKIIHFDNVSSYLYIKYKVYISLDGAPKANVDSVSHDSCIITFDNRIPERICEVCDSNNNVLAKGAYSCTVKDLEGDSAYTFRVKYEGGIEYNTIQVITKPSFVNPPTNIVIEDILKGCIVSWTPSVLKYWSVSYQVKVYDNAGSVLIQTLDNITANSCEIYDLEIGVTYQLNIFAKSEGMVSSPVIVSKYIPAPPAAPTNLSLHRPADRIHVLTWTYSSVDIDDFVVKRFYPDPKELIVKGSVKGADFGTISLGGAEYIYFIQARKGRLISENATLNFIEPPFPPLNFHSVLDVNNHRKLYWENSSLNKAVDGFLIKQTSPTTKTFTVGKEEKSLDIGETFDGLTYSFTVQACLGQLQSKLISLSFNGDLLGAPINFRATNPTGSIYVLLWDYSSSANIDDFVLIQKAPKTNTYVINKSVRGFEVGITTSTVYSYTIQARKNGKLSPIVAVGFMGGEKSKSVDLDGNIESNELE